MPRFSTTLLLLAIVSWLFCALISFVPFPRHGLCTLLNLLSYFQTPGSYANPSSYSQSTHHLSHLSHQNVVAMLCFLFAIACSFVAGGVWGMEYQAERLDRSRYAEAVQDVEYSNVSLQKEGGCKHEDASDDGSVTEKGYAPYRDEDGSSPTEVGELSGANEFWRTGHKEGWAAYHAEAYGECEEDDEVVGDAMVSETPVDQTSRDEVAENQDFPRYFRFNRDPMIGHMHACMPECVSPQLWKGGMHHVEGCWACNDDQTARLPPTPSPPMMNRYTDSEIAEFGAARLGLGFAPSEVYENYYTHKAAVDMRSGAMLYTVCIPRSSTPVPHVHPNPFSIPYSDTPVGRTSEEREPRSAFEYSIPTQEETEEREANGRKADGERQNGLAKEHCETVAEVGEVEKITCGKNCCTEDRVF